MTASSGEKSCGTGTIKSRSTQIRSVMAPSCGGAPMKRTLGQRLGWPARHGSQRPQAWFGSTATRAPRDSPRSGRSAASQPPNSWPGTNGSEITADPMPPSL